MAATFQEIFESILNFHAPLRKKRIRPDPAPWITPEVRKLMKERDRAKKDAMNSLDLWQSYRTLRNKVTKAIRDALQSYYLGLIDENKENPNRMWKAVNKVLNKETHSTEISSLDIDGRTTNPYQREGRSRSPQSALYYSRSKTSRKLESKNGMTLL
eukprot:gene3915-4457_t